ncbi:hypothetical protein KC19_12G085500 [Ceratodon purpureus]|uniref:Poly(A) RNA polymerase mitochondrial-like central palm domain-containing protein n=1 Tax=Ceratodon purpureus TaxID=3225 RepID=A0A8T0G506_CERPU|nr:hypothetical protein KC19_12G085500 [Ceratodon purpureus]
MAVYQHVEVARAIQAGAMTAQGEDEKEGFVEEGHLDSGQEGEDDGAEGYFVPECRIVVPPPSHVMFERALQFETQREDMLQWDPESKRLVDRMLIDVYVGLQPTKEQQDARRSVIQFVDTFVKQRIHGSHIAVFGSYVMDLYTGSSDLDLSLNVGYSQMERSRADKIAILRKLTRALYSLHNGRNGTSRHTVRKIEPVMRAAVPVVKFMEGYTNIECDISMENKDGVLKSELIGIFTQIDPRYRQLCFLLKAWAKNYNVNDSKKGTLNSLSICLLAAFHLQTRSPAILPSFSTLLEGLVLRETEKCIAAVKERVALHTKNCFGRDNKETLSELFGSFFIKFIAVESLWEQGLCASVFEGKWISKVWPKNHLGCMSVEDFAERSQNCARAVREKEFDIIHQSFRDTISLLNLSMGSSSQILEIKHTLFGFKSLKRTSEEPLIRPVEKHLKVTNGWTNSAFSNSASFAGPDLNGYPMVGGPYGVVHPGHAVYSNHNQNLHNISRQQAPPLQSYQHYPEWAAGRGIISSIPGAQPPHFADSPGHDQMRPRMNSQPFQAQQIHQSQMGYPAYNTQSPLRSFNYQAARDMGPGISDRGMLGPGNANMVGPLLYQPYQARPHPGAMYFPPPDNRMNLPPQRQSPHWSYNQSPAQGDHASYLRRSNR